METVKIQTLKDMATGEPIAPRTHLSALSGAGKKGQVVGFTEDNVLGIIDSTDGGSVAIYATLYASKWEDGAQDIVDPRIVGSSNGVIGMAQDTSIAQINAINKARIRISEYGDGRVVVKALGKTPEIDIPVSIILCDKESITEATLKANNWVDGKQKVAISEVNENSNGFAGISQESSDHEMEVACEAGLNVCDQGDGYITIAALNATPEIDIKVSVILIR